MRIVGGSLGGRRITPPAQMPHTRPTTDIAKEGLFNTLQNMIDFEDIHCLDLFGGTGCISYELASRGAASIVNVEKDPTMFAFIKKTAEQLKISVIKQLRLDVFKYLENANEAFDFIFAGPPYALGTIDDLPRIIVSKQLLKPGGVFVLEHTPRNAYEDFELFTKAKNYGTTIFSFFCMPDQA
ncbi:MAG: hypothetical protein RL660_2811 [Bacteroidota bacterium]|jgi:16S rRNA (guanine(966)-N(2))-methyltransferase RsmD